MNTRRFVGKFPEIAHLDAQEQATILEAARYEAFVNLGMTGRAAFYFVACLVLGFTLSVALAFALGYPSVISFFSIPAGSILASLLYQRLYRSLVLLGLRNVLAGKTEP